MRIQNKQTNYCQPKRNGQVLVEFAIISFVLTLLLSAVVVIGFMFFSANLLQQAVDVGAMELSRHSYAATGSFEAALDDSGLFNEEDLVVATGTDPDTLPLINRLLFPLYIYDVDIDMIRYPGTLVENGDGEMTVVIPLVGPGNRDPITGIETISEWRHVIEEVIPATDNSTGLPATSGPYAIDSTSTGNLDPGVVAMRVNYPYQAAALVAYTYTDPGGNAITPREAITTDGVQNYAVNADDSQVAGANTATFPDGQTLLGAGYTLVDPAPNPLVGGSPHRGTYGFGEMRAHATTVRPYRKVLTSQAIYRRELFE